MKTFRKITALLISAIMLMSSTAFAAATATATVDSANNDKLTLVINCGGVHATQLIKVEIFEPDSEGLEALNSGSGYTVTDPAVLNATLSYVMQHTSDATGKITINYTPKGKKGLYTVRLGYPGTSEKEILTFEYKSGNEATQIIADLQANPTADNVKAVFATDADNVFTEYEFLEIDTADTTKDIYEDFMALTPAQKDAAYANMANNITASTTPVSFRNNVFRSAAYITLTDVLEGEELLRVIDENKAFSGMATAGEYTIIREDETVFGNAIKSNFLTTVAGTDLSTKTVPEITTFMKTALLESALSYAQAEGTIETLIGSFAAEITAAGGNAAGFAACTNKSELAGKLIETQPYTNLAAFAAQLNSVVTNDGITTTPGATAPGGIIVDTPSNAAGGNGSGNGSGSSITRPVPGTNIYTDNGTPGSTPATEVFTDLGNHEWARTAIETLKAKNIVSGKSATEFAPEDTVLREEFAKMIMLAVLPAGVGSVDGEIGYSDVAADAWYAPYIAGATKTGVITGYDGMFGTGNTIRREDMAVMCYRAIKAAGFNLAEEKAEPQFRDAISDYAKEAITAMYKAGLINGYSDTEFGANGTATRAEAAMILFNVVQRYGK